MGAKASVKLHSGSSSSILAVAQMDDKLSGAMLPTNSGDDPTLLEVLRKLHLSPDLINKSAAAIYAHVRDPVEHPIDKELVRLCASEYTRGALHALSLYLVAVSTAESDGRNGCNVTRNSAHEVEVDKTKSTSFKRGRTTTPAAAPSAEAGSGNGETSPSPALIVSPSIPSALGNTGKLAAFWNMLSKPSNKGQGGVIIPTEEGEDLVRHHHHKSPTGGSAEELDLNKSPTKSRAAASSANADTPAKLNVRVGAAPKNTKKSNSLLAGLGLGSPSGRAAGEVATPRRAPVRTGHWKLGHEIGKGSFGAVHIGLNEDTGVRVEVWCMCIRRYGTNL